MSLEDAFGGREFRRPIELGAYPAGPDPAGGVFVAEQDGRIYVLHEGGEALLLDLSPQVSRASNEEGLLSVAVDPQFATNRLAVALLLGRPLLRNRGRDARGSRASPSTRTTRWPWTWAPSS